MKKLLMMLAWTTCFCITAMTALSQEKAYKHAAPVPAWVSEKGYWVVESNLKTPGNAVIYFYNNENVLIYKEQVEGMKLNLHKKKILKCLKVVLEQAVIAWEKQPVPKENERLVATAFKKH